MALLEERLLDDLLLSARDKEGKAGHSGDEEVRRGLQVLHEVYGASLFDLSMVFLSMSQRMNLLTQASTILSCMRNQGDIYQAFHRQWVLTDPENVMAFPTIFDEVKGQQTRRFKSLRGDTALFL